MAVCLLAGTASVAPAFSFHRATSAPAAAANLNEYAMQSDDTTGTAGDQGGEGPVIQQDTSSTRANQGSVQNPLDKRLADSLARQDSLRGLPHNQPAPFETLAPGPGYVPPIHTSGGATSHGPAKRPLFGLSSIALVLGLVVLHVLIVSWVAK